MVQADKRGPRPTLATWLGVGILLLPVLLLIPATDTVCWVGSTDLEIEFAVTDAATGQPVPGATIRIYSEGGFYAGADHQPFTLTTDEGGMAIRLCKDSMCFGKRSRYTDTYVVHLPIWYYRVGAPGHVRSEMMELDVPENVRRVQRGTPARLVVPVRLEKQPAVPPRP